MTRIQDWQREAWANGPLGGTPITAERLTNIEEGIEALQEAALTPVEPPEPISVDGLFRGDWVAGQYAAKDMVFYNGKLYAAKVATSASPTLPEARTSTPVGGSAWSRNNVASTSSDLVLLNDGSDGRVATVISNEVFTDFRGLTLHFDMRNDSIQNANIQICIVPEDMSPGTVGGNGLRGGGNSVWGYFLETGGGYMPITNGNVNGGAGNNPTTGGATARYSLKFTDTNMAILRDGNPITNVDSIPPYHRFRMAVASQYAGAVVSISGTPGTSPGALSPDWRILAQPTDIPSSIPTTADVKNIVKITQAAYDALASKSATTLYMIVG